MDDTPTPSPRRAKPLPSRRRTLKRVDAGSAHAVADEWRTRSSTEHFVFFPEPLPRCGAASTRSNDAELAYLFGWCTTGATVIAGSLQASSLDSARSMLRASLGREADVQIRGRCYQASEETSTNGTAGSENDKMIFLDVRISAQGVPTVIGASPSATVVLYSPPSRTQLQFFSLQPLQLDLNSFTSPQKNGFLKKAKLSPTSQKKRAAALPQQPHLESEREILGGKLRHSAVLDFTREDPKMRLCADLEQVVDWVSRRNPPPATSYS